MQLNTLNLIFEVYYSTFLIMILLINGRHVEELVRLPECFLCYTPSPEAGPVSPAPALSNGFITFGSFNNLAKVLVILEWDHWFTWKCIFIEVQLMFWYPLILFFIFLSICLSFIRLPLRCCKFGQGFYVLFQILALWWNVNLFVVIV